MKKTGFTLAEVLITLAIIGVVATMTLPALMTNTNEQQARTALKKMINTLTLAAETNSANNGFDYASITSNNTTSEGDMTQSLFNLLATNTNIDRAASGDDFNTEMHVAADNFTVFLKDGTAVSYNPATLSTDANVSTIYADGVIKGIPVLVDINGRKGPNALSNCTGTALLLSTAGTDDTSDDAACDNRTQRVIKDQFGVRLRGIYAEPNGAAARWAFNN